MGIRISYWRGAEAVDEERAGLSNIDAVSDYRPHQGGASD
jgi:hypothetical protein